VLSFKMRRPTRRHYFLRINFWPSSFFMRTTHAKINPANTNRIHQWHQRTKLTNVKYAVEKTETTTVSLQPMHHLDHRTHHLQSPSHNSQLSHRAASSQWASVGISPASTQCWHAAPTCALGWQIPTWRRCP